CSCKQPDLVDGSIRKVRDMISSPAKSSGKSLHHFLVVLYDGLKSRLGADQELLGWIVPRLQWLKVLKKNILLTKLPSDDQMKNATDKANCDFPKTWDKNDVYAKWSASLETNFTTPSQAIDSLYAKLEPDNYNTDPNNDGNFRKARQLELLIVFQYRLETFDKFCNET